MGTVDVVDGHTRPRKKKEATEAIEETNNKDDTQQTNNSEYPGIQFEA
jgi:hypothetical protein